MGKLKIFFKNMWLELNNIFTPRDKSIVLMGAWFGKRFADNSRYLFQYLSDNKEKLGLTRVVWVTASEALKQELADMGYEAYMMDSEESLEVHKKAGIHIICNSSSSGNGRSADILTEYSNGAFKINLWHGLGGIKGVSYASKEHIEGKKNQPLKYGLKEWLRKRKFYRKYMQLPGGWANCYYLTTTPLQTKIFQQYFCLPTENFIESGYPRNQIDIKLRKSEIDVIDRIKKSGNTILYMPTFRENNSLYKAPLTDASLISMIEEKGWLWIEKKHGADETSLLDSVGNYAVLQLDADFDANVILPYVDLVITDYSSVSWDALYHGKPVIFYMPDFKYYMEEDRGFVLKPEEFIIGPAVYSIGQLKETLKIHQAEFPKMLPENEKELFEKFWGEKKDCSQIWDDIQKRMEK